ncbi:MAG: phenylalanine--tRNA ligase subunit beta, partial [Deltaproteobacteria bacterium]|nr:phenylalanine--tRNA ligase subunit beta [Deltaproteobacteria bacterium]
PLHAFDFGFLKGSEIQIRRANPGETIATLDGVKRKLTAEDLVIADGERPVAIAGVMGGENSEINPGTKEIVLESANFNAASVRRTAIRHSMRTEASSRFEKSLDPDFAEIGTGLFTRMLLGLVPEARVHSRLYDEGIWRHERRIIHISCPYIRERLGADIPDGEIIGYISSLQFGVRKKDQILEVEVPSWRATKDISIPEDIVEEIGRLYGYDNIVPMPPKMAVKAVGRLPGKILEERVKDLMSLALGFYEISTYSFDSQAFLNRIGYALGNQVFLKNPISQDFPALRTDLEPNMLSAVEKNANRKKSFRIYEVGRVFSSVRTAENLPAEESRLCAAIRCQTRERDKYDAVFYDIKGTAEALLSKLGIGFTFEKAAEHELWTHPARSADILSRGVKIGSIYEVHPEVMHRLDLQGRCALMSLSLTNMLKVSFDEFRYDEIPKFPGIQYDISVIVPVEVEARALKEIIGRSGSGLIKEIEIFAVYEGDPIPQGKKSVSFSILFQSRDKTLEDPEVQEIIKKIVGDFESAGGYLRMN